MKDRQYSGQKFEDTKVVIRSLKLKDRHTMAKSLKTAKGYSEVLNQRRTYNTMDKCLKIPKGVISSLKLKDRQYNGQQFEDSKGAIRSLKLNKDKQYRTMAKSLKIPKG